MSDAAYTAVSYGNIVQLGKATAGAADGAEGEALVKDQPVLVLVLQLNLDARQSEM
jgi:hypothetical protein